MSNLPQQTTINQYQGDGSTVAFTFVYYIPLNTDIAVYLTPPNTPPNPTVDLQVLGTDYNVTGAGNPTFSGGTVTFVTAPLAGATVTLIRNIQFSIDTTFSNAQTINGANLDNAFQRLTLMCQQLNSFYNLRGLQYIPDSFIPMNNSTQELIIPINQLPTLANQQIWMGSTGGQVIAATLEENPDVSTLRAELASEVQGGDGAALIGYYDNVNNVPQTLDHFLNNLPTYITNFNNTFISTQQYTDTGSANSVVVALPASYTSYVTGTYIRVKVANTNTAASTLNINGIGTRNIINPSGNGIFAGDMHANMIAEFVITASAAMLLNPQTYLNRKFYGAGYAGSTTTLPAGNVPTGIAFSSVEFDPYTITGANAITPSLSGGGYFIVTAQINLPATAENHAVQLILYKNSSAYRLLDMQILTATDSITLSGSTTLFLNGSTDFVELVGSNFGASPVTLSAGAELTSFAISLQGQ